MHQVAGKTAALLLHQLPGLNINNNNHKRMSDEEELLFFPDQAMLGGPPTFNIPPPPRPPWMMTEATEEDHCQEDVSLSEWLSQMQSCDSLTLISRDSQSYFEDTFHSIAIIVVCSIILVILILALGLYVFKRRKTLQPYTTDPRHLSGSLDHHGSSTMTTTASMRSPRFVGNVNPAIDCATPTHLSHTLGPMKPRQVLYEGQAVTSLMHNGLTMTRCLANHYIPDHQKMMTLDNSEVNRQQIIADELRQRFGPFPDRRNVMELSERPPMPVPSGVYQMADYPHIVIGGKPFFLIPSSEAGSMSEAANTTTNSNSEAYAYPQHMPIYEEIDYNAVGKVVMDRPLSSATSHSNSAHTNTSELSSSGDTSSSSSQKNMEEGSQSLQFYPLGQISRNARLAEGPERSRSPHSIYSLRKQQQLQQNNQLPASSSSSVYYYSDTLRNTYANDNNVANKVNTRVILAEEERKKKKGSTLV